VKLESIVIFILRLGAVVLLLATIAIVMPFSWMAAAYPRLGFHGELPDLPIVGYLTRSLSLVYALWGVTLWYVSLDIRRYLPIVRVLGCLNIILGIVLTTLDYVLGMPAYWTIIEGATVIPYGAALWWAARQYEAARLV
jgi:hypothetical protein